MRRREFITLVGGAVAWPLGARAQQPAKLPTIGVLGATSPSAWGSWTAAFVQRLRELGWIEGSTVAIQYRWADPISAVHSCRRIGLAPIEQNFSACFFSSINCAF